MHPEHKIQFDPRKFVVVPEFSAEAFKELQHTDSSSVGMAMQWKHEQKMSGWRPASVASFLPSFVKDDDSDK